LFQAIQDHILGISRCLEINNQKEGFAKIKFGSMGVTGVEENFHTKKNSKKGHSK